MKQFFLAAGMLPFIFACNGPSTEHAQETTAAAAIDTAAVAIQRAEAPVVKSFKTNSGKTIVVTETHPTGASLSTVDVRFDGDTAPAYVFTDIDAVAQVLQGDLDGNGFDEIYIITQAAGSGSYGNVYGMVSNNDKSLTPVNLDEMTEKDMAAGKPFEGYTGHDQFRIEGKELIREFPITKAGQSARMIHYTLKPGEAAWKLVIKASMDK